VKYVTEAFLFAVNNPVMSFDLIRKWQICEWQSVWNVSYSPQSSSEQVKIRNLV